MQALIKTNPFLPFLAGLEPFVAPTLSGSEQLAEHKATKEALTAAHANKNYNQLTPAQYIKMFNAYRFGDNVFGISKDIDAAFAMVKTIDDNVHDSEGLGIWLLFTVGDMARSFEYRKSKSYDQTTDASNTVAVSISHPDVFTYYEIVLRRAHNDFIAAEATWRLAEASLLGVHLSNKLVYKCLVDAGMTTPKPLDQRLKELYAAYEKLPEYIKGTLKPNPTAQRVRAAFKTMAGYQKLFGVEGHDQDGFDAFSDVTEALDEIKNDPLANFLAGVCALRYPENARRFLGKAPEGQTYTDQAETLFSKCTPKGVILDEYLGRKNVNMMEFMPYAYHLFVADLRKRAVPAKELDSDKTAQLAVAIIFDKGLFGVEPNEKEAFRYYRGASSAKIPYAQQREEDLRGKYEAEILADGLAEQNRITAQVQLREQAKLAEAHHNHLTAVGQLALNNRAMILEHDAILKSLQDIYGDEIKIKAQRKEIEQNPVAAHFLQCFATVLKNQEAAARALETKEVVWQDNSAMGKAAKLATKALLIDPTKIAYAAVSGIGLLIRAKHLNDAGKRNSSFLALLGADDDAASSTAQIVTFELLKTFNNPAHPLDKQQAQQMAMVIFEMLKEQCANAPAMEAADKQSLAEFILRMLKDIPPKYQFKQLKPALVMQTVEVDVDVSVKKKSGPFGLKKKTVTETQKQKQTKEVQGDSVTLGEVLMTGPQNLSCLSTSPAKEAADIVITDSGSEGSDGYFPGGGSPGSSSGLSSSSGGDSPPPPAHHDAGRKQPPPPPPAKPAAIKMKPLPTLPA